ncbi:MAG: hypothetical protein ACXV5H_04780 [Halobacteriota archaeon]
MSNDNAQPSANHGNERNKLLSKKTRKINRNLIARLDALYRENAELYKENLALRTLLVYYYGAPEEAISAIRALEDVSYGLSD